MLLTTAIPNKLVSLPIVKLTTYTDPDNDFDMVDFDVAAKEFQSLHDAESFFDFLLKAVQSPSFNITQIVSLLITKSKNGYIVTALIGDQFWPAVNQEGAISTWNPALHSSDITAGWDVWATDLGDTWIAHITNGELPLTE